MKTAAWKKVLLLVLIIVLIYIWWGAFQVMYPDSSDFARVRVSEAPQTPEAAASAGLLYQEPKTNPFFRPSQKPVEDQRPSPPRPQPHLVLSLSPSHRLIGVLALPEQPQAVISSEGGSSVFSLGDSLGDWQLIRIVDNYVVFKHEIQRDTLWLYEKTE